ncbi:UNKNOWN [Stylonychia lemnae]|uniref:Uncharacterized protein n=1 Tax=Stylonychia lemnae TaxID=5949 RepID=A0A078AHK3_STYLE|nr:UNKNOWN [Stylonychia lemnae]|eukprot:CDW81724.1 UNKNOWN [Stylonychia lemnae]
MESPQNRFFVKKQKLLKLKVVQHYPKEKQIINSIKSRISRDRQFEPDQEEVNTRFIYSQLLYNHQSPNDSGVGADLHQNFSLNITTPHRNSIKNIFSHSLQPTHRNMEASKALNQTQEKTDSLKRLNFGAPALYKIGEFKEYRKYVGKELIRNIKRQELVDRSRDREIEDLDLVNQISYGYQNASSLSKNETLRKSGNNLGSQVYFPKIQKQKVIDQFINLSNADMMNQGISQRYKNLYSNGLSPTSIINQNLALTLRNKELSTQRTNGIDEHFLNSRESGQNGGRTIDPNQYQDFVSSNRPTSNPNSASMNPATIRKIDQNQFNQKLHQFSKLKEDYLSRFRENHQDSQKLDNTLEMNGVINNTKYQVNHLKAIYHVAQGEFKLKSQNPELALQYDPQIVIPSLRQYTSEEEEPHNQSMNKQSYLYTSINDSVEHEDLKHHSIQETLNNHNIQKSPRKKKKRKIRRHPKSIQERLKQLQEERKKIQEQLRNKYYWNNFTMKKDDLEEDEGKQSQLSESQQELQRNMRILRKFQRFPLTELQIERKAFLNDMKQKYGEGKIDMIVAQQIDEYKFKNLDEKADELYNLQKQSINH